MKQNLCRALKQEFSPPPPERKEAFLSSLPQKRMSWWAFLWSQAGYLGKGSWVFSLLVFAAALAGARLWDGNALISLGACMPMLALTLVTESGRSELYGMAEFEQSSRFSLRGVLLARLAILGTGNLLVFCLVLPLAEGSWGIFQRGVYLGCPYLLTTCLGLAVVRRLRGKEGLYLSILAALGVSVGGLLVAQSFPQIYAPQEFFWWVLALGALALGTGKQCVSLVNQREERAWSL